MIKDYTNAVNDSDDEDDPRTPTSVSSQGSHGYDSADQNFVDVERFTTIPNSSELNIQVNIEIFEKCKKVNKCHQFLQYFIL